MHFDFGEKVDFITMVYNKSVTLISHHAAHTAHFDVKWAGPVKLSFLCGEF